MLLTEYSMHVKSGDWTEAFAHAIADLKKTGGTLTVPAGEYQTHSIELFSHMTLHIETGARIIFYKEPEGYQVIQLPFEGIMGSAYMPLIYATKASHVTVTGGGVLDGNGSVFWEQVRDKTITHQRPYFVCFNECTDVVLENVTLLNSPAWTVHPLNCNHVTVRGVTIHNPWDSPNTDGINPDSCQNVRISDCLIDVGDDCIAIKSGTEDTFHPKPCENIIITNCMMLNGHGGVVIGSEMSGGVRNVLVTGCVFKGTDRGIRLKTRRFRGGVVSNISFSHILMEDVKCPFVFNMFYFCGKNGRTEAVRNKQAQTVDEKTPRISDVRIESVTATNATACAGFVYGLPESNVERISINNVTVTMKPGEKSYAAMMDDLEEMEACGFYLRNAKDITLSNVNVVNHQGDAVNMDETVTLIGEKSI